MVLTNTVWVASLHLGKNQLVNCKLVSQSATTGIDSTVTLTDGNLFRACVGFAGRTESVRGADTLLEALTNTLTPAGPSLLATFPVCVVGTKPITLQRATKLLAYQKTDGKWYFYDTDEEINA